MLSCLLDPLLAPKAHDTLKLAIGLPSFPFVDAAYRKSGLFFVPVSTICFTGSEVTFDTSSLEDTGLPFSLTISEVMFLIPGYPAA